MEARRRSHTLLVGICLIAFANGFLLVLTLYGLLAAFLHLFHDAAPPFWLAIVAGALVGGGVLAVAAARERALARGEFFPWSLGPTYPGAEREWEEVAAAIAAGADVARSPRLRFVEGSIPNAFVIDHAEDPAVIVMTEGVGALAPEQV